VFEPLANIAKRRRVVRLGPAAIENGERIQAVRVGKPPVAEGGYAGESPADVVAAAKFRFFGDEQAQKGFADISEADDGEVVRRNVRLQSSSGQQRSRVQLRVRPGCLQTTLLPLDHWQPKR
jgi:hypothetical protein